MDRVVGIGEYVISNNREDVIKTYALASCVAVTVYSASNYVAGMVHIVLPDIISHQKEVCERPCYYATIAVPYLINKMCLEYGCLKSELVVELFGGAKSRSKNDIFQVGYKNIVIIEEILKKLNLNYINIETGGTNSRTLELDVETGRKKITKQPLLI